MIKTKVNNPLLDLYSNKNSLFGQQWAGFKQVAAERRVLVGDIWWSCGALQVQTADDHVEDSRHCRQLHAIKHGGQLRAESVHVTVLDDGHCGD